MMEITPMKHATLATAADLVAWADRMDALSQLPRLVRKLAHATADGISHIGFPADEGVRAPGFDGLLVVEKGGAHVPSGASVWELSTRKDVSTKVEEDYRKRTEVPNGAVPSNSTYVAVSLRRWPGKEAWAQERQKEGVWKEVRAYDAEDLEQWLEQAPAVHLWVSLLVGKHPDGAIDLGDLLEGLVCLDTSHQPCRSSSWPAGRSRQTPSGNGSKVLRRR